MAKQKKGHIDVDARLGEKGVLKPTEHIRIVKEIVN